MNLEERIKRVEEILIYQHGSLDLDVMKEKDDVFFKEANERLANINKGLAENDVLIEELHEARDERMASREDLEKYKKTLGL